MERLRKIKKNVIVHQVAYCGGMTYNEKSVTACNCSVGLRTCSADRTKI
ncbi:hypothetical protein CLOSTASPAR_01853 [[Clostridium] asparagiforme DSM 15981]|uniref:Uncharacterized protein n=1 Tax=[Clostridium] asparagiforme DSM 15981 TaxID=518636 RepID=C0CXX8_9FIRM|nr:hypothetical protein CLOSTASPAR_01853 [[Clostridium] asparagiforme DSM 15981]